MKQEVSKGLKEAKAPDHIPYLDLITVKEALRLAKHTWSQAPGDLIPSLRKEFFQWLAEPFLDIVRKIVVIGEWPVKWKIE